MQLLDWGLEAKEGNSEYPVPLCEAFFCDLDLVSMVLVTYFTSHLSLGRSDVSQAYQRVMAMLLREGIIDGSLVSLALTP